jgi:hypothetical protein
MAIIAKKGTAPVLPPYLPHISPISPCISLYLPHFFLYLSGSQLMKEMREKREREKAVKDQFKQVSGRE